MNDITFSLRKGETLGVVGESGSGKTTTARMILGILTPTSGTVYLDGVDLYKAKGRVLQELKRRIGVVFQDPYSSLNPVKTVGQIIGLPLRVLNKMDNRDVNARVDELLEQVGIESIARSRYPHMFSGGQRQRIAIARALATKPELIVLDEPVSALDVSIQVQILNLLEDIKNELNLSYVFIAHNLGVVHRMCDRIIVMYLGKIMEVGLADDIAFNPLHPYTKALMSAIPTPDPKAKWGVDLLEGEVPNPTNPPRGCVFKTRCPAKGPNFGYGDDTVCDKIEPELIGQVEGHAVACHLYSGSANSGSNLRHKIFERED